MITRPISQPISRPVAGRVTTPRGASGPAPTRGPELFTAFTNFVAGGTTPPTIDATGIQFTAAGSGSLARLDIATEDNATYEVIWTISGRSSGSSFARVYGATANHFSDGATNAADGTYTQQIVTTGGTSSTAGQLRFNTLTASTTLKITAVSCKKVLA